jgi:hypothetical protein
MGASPFCLGAKNERVLCRVFSELLFETRHGEQKVNRVSIQCLIHGFARKALVDPLPG